MAGSQQRKVIEDLIVEIDDLLRAATPGPAVRELRVRHGSLARVVRAWGDAGPHASQLGAMVECVLELRASVLKACPPRVREGGANRASRPPARPTARAIPVKTLKSTRPPPRRANANRTTRPPPRRGGSGPPSSRRG